MPAAVSAKATAAPPGAACPTSLKVLGVDDDGLAATELCGWRRRLTSAKITGSA